MSKVYSYEGKDDVEERHPQTTAAELKFDISQQHRWMVRGVGLTHVHSVVLVEGPTLPTRRRPSNATVELMTVASTTQHSNSQASSTLSARGLAEDE